MKKLFLAACLLAGLRSSAQTVEVRWMNTTTYDMYGTLTGDNTVTTSCSRTWSTLMYFINSGSFSSVPASSASWAYPGFPVPAPNNINEVNFMQYSGGSFLGAVTFPLCGRFNGTYPVTLNPSMTTVYVDVVNYPTYISLTINP
ncbi:MAG TPA: hypothetical protein VL092_05370 [Chitinophagaceae bacterium]|nr:hypothetical protein [Chitinophagaceae bacterium]